MGLKCQKGAGALHCALASRQFIIVLIWSVSLPLSMTLSVSKHRGLCVSLYGLCKMFDLQRDHLSHSSAG